MADVQDIDAGGDVVLICGTGEEQQKYRVSSNMLSRTSKVFSAMLSNKYQEGTQLQANGTTEISLADDDAAAMSILTRIMHMEYDEMPSTLSTAQLWDVARLVDKYDACKIIKPMAKCWIMALLPTADNEIRQALMIAAYHFRYAEVFSKRDYACGVGISSEMLVVFDALGKQKQEALDAAATAVEDVAQDAALTKEIQGYSCQPDCSTAERRLQYILSCLMIKKLWPRKEMMGFALVDVLNKMQNTGMSDDTLRNIKGVRNCSGRMYGQCISADVWCEASTLGSTVASDLRVLCYECVRQGKVLDPDCVHGQVKKVAE